MAFDYKKGYKEFYLPKLTPSIVEVPLMNYMAVRGKGDPNYEEGEYKHAMNILYSVAYTIKMSKMGSHRIEGYFDYVVPPLEGLCVDIDLANRFHHVIYLSDPRKTEPEKLKTVIRYPVKK